MGLLRRRRRQRIWSAKSSRYSVKWTDDGPVNTGLEQQELAILVDHYDAHMVPVAQRYRSKHRCG